MKKEWKDKWLAALRSGDYRQGQGGLRMVNTEKGEPTGYCCLGVLCDLYDSSRWDSIYPNTYLISSDPNETNSRLGFLPKDVADAVGLENHGEDYDPENQQTKLAHLNDSGKSFEEIADYVEANL